MTRVSWPGAVGLLLLLTLLIAACGDDPARADPAPPPVAQQASQPDAPSADAPSQDAQSADARSADAAPVAAEEPVAEAADERPVAREEAEADEEPVATAAEADEEEPAEAEAEAEPVAAPEDDAPAAAPEADAGDDPTPAPAVADADTDADDDADADADADPDPRLAFLSELTDPADREVIALIGATVAERRGLALLREVPVYLLRRPDLPAFFEADDDLDDDDPDDRVRERIFQLLGLIGGEASLDELYRDIFVGLALGFYHTEIEGFVIISANDHVARGDIDTIAHEFVHVLQDQHFDIGGYFDTHRDNQDRILAARFIIEGDASNSEALFEDLAVALAPELEPRRDRAPGLTGSVPPLLQLIFTAPYTTGVRVVAQVLRDEGQAGVDALLVDLPPSTEQLLHPDKRAADEQPIDVDAPDVSGVLGESWRAVGSDTVGEFILRILLSPVTGGAVATQAAAGWGGDRLTAYRGPDDASLLVWESRWDTLADAEELVAALRSWLPARTGAPIVELAPGTELRSDGPRASAWVRRSGDAVFVVIGEAAAAVEQVGLVGLR